MDTLRFAIGGDKQSVDAVKSMLQLNGHLIACEDMDGPSFLRKVRALSPDFVIVDYYMEGMKGIEIARIVQEDKIAPVIITADSSKDIFIREMGDESFPYLIKPIVQAQLLGLIEYVYNNFKRLSYLEKQVLELKNMLEARKLIEKAKGILIDKYKMKEQDAFRFIQKQSMDKCVPAIEIAKLIIKKTTEK